MSSPPIGRNFALPLCNAAVLQQAQRERERAAALGTDGHPASCKPRELVDLRLLRAQEYPHRLVIERAERNDGRLAVDVGQRLADAALDERDIDPAIAKSAKFSAAPRVSRNSRRYAVLARDTPGTSRRISDTRRPARPSP